MTYYSEFLPYTFLSVALVASYYLFENKLTQPWMRWSWWVVSVSIVIVVGWHVGINHGWPDFGDGYYYAGRKIIHNPNKIYDSGMYVNFPLFAYLFAPLGAMPKESAGRIFFVINEISILLLAYWLVKFGRVKGWARWLILFLLALNGPLDYSIWLGNSTNLIVLIMILALWNLQHGKQWLAGILLGVNGLIKIPLIMPAGYFFVRRQWKVVGGGVLIVAIVFALSVILIPASLNWSWLNEHILVVRGTALATYNNQTVAGVLARELIPDSSVDRWITTVPTPLFNFASWLTTILIYLPVAFILFVRWKHPPGAPEQILDFFIILLCSLLTSPISWTHYYVFLLVAAVFYFDKANYMPQKHLLNFLVGSALLLLTFPQNMTLTLFESTGNRIFLSIHFIGGLLFYIFLLWFWWFRWKSRDFVEKVDLESADKPGPGVDVYHGASPSPSPAPIIPTIDP
jgi:hypothetical protein